MVKAIRIKDFPDYYITDTGDVYSRQTWRNPNGRIKKLKPWINKFGYKMVDLVKYGQKIHKFVHRLVAEAFIPKPVGMSGKFGKDCPLSKIVFQIKDGKIIAEFYGVSEACRQTGVDFRCISSCCLGHCKAAGGYQWRYKDEN